MCWVRLCCHDDVSHDTGDKPLVEACGPAKISTGDEFYVDGTRARTNSGEMEGLIEALFLLKHLRVEASSTVMITVGLAPRQGARG